MNINQFSWAHPLSMVLPEGTLSSRSLKRPKSTLLESRVTLLSPFRSLNSTILWPLQLRMPLTFTSPLSPSLLMNMRSSRVFLCVGSSVTWRRNLSSRTCCVPEAFWIAYVLLCCHSSRYWRSCSLLSAGRGADSTSLHCYIFWYTKFSFSTLGYAALYLLTLTRDEKLISILFLLYMSKLSFPILFLNPSCSYG